MSKGNTKKAKEEFEEVPELKEEKFEDATETNEEEQDDQLPAAPVKGAVAEDDTKPVEGAVADNTTPPIPGPNPKTPEESKEESPKDPAETKAPEETTKKGHVTGTSALRIRHLPNLKSQEMGIMMKGDEVIISLIDSTEKFYSIRFGKIEGFCLKEFITLA